MEVPVSKELWLNYPASGFPITTSVSPEAPGRKYTTLCWHLPGHTQSVPPSSRARPWQALRSTGTWRRVQDTVKPQRIWACPSPLRQSWRNPQKEEVCPDHKAFVKRTPGRQLSQVPSWRGPHRISPKIWFQNQRAKWRKQEKSGNLSAPQQPGEAGLALPSNMDVSGPVLTPTAMTTLVPPTECCLLSQTQLPSSWFPTQIPLVPWHPWDLQPLPGPLTQHPCVPTFMFPPLHPKWGSICATST